MFLMFSVLQETLQHRYETYLTPGETLIPGGRGKRLGKVLDMPQTLAMCRCYRNTRLTLCPHIFPLGPLDLPSSHLKPHDFFIISGGRYEVVLLG